MKCKSVNKYLYLNDAELTGKEKEKINKHLSGCGKCRDELIKFETYQNYMNDIKSFNPAAPDSMQAADAIMEAVMNLRGGNTGLNTANNFTHLINIFSFPRARFALILLLALIIGSFLAEEISTASQINKLEIQMNNRSSLLSAASESIPANKDLFKKLKGALDLLSGNKNSIELPAGWMLLKENDLINVLTSYNKLQNLFESNSGIDLTNYPLLKKINLKDGLDKEELQLLINNRDEMEKEMKKLLIGRNKDEYPIK